MLKDSMEYLPIILPLLTLQLVLMITALIHLFKHPNVRRGNKVVWVIVVVFVNIFGPILYFLIGRGED
ncbi:PLDc N-terminal domain-containing protein [Mesobacillus zeae]|uniref:Cardiolipin synthase N-terminal domain-containing protein n=1 Tax=Mesobacillus zeae TaxID=1917180 RepID=A0A398B0R6_9BACI|nr:PLDc N-terminal domain-containing protein [Mesobacillus zeae]RID83362.1 hypothetical protein D1970_15875 [Mesobacillus zeae]